MLTDIGPHDVMSDPSGQDRMAWNVVASWAGHAVFIVAGFVMPRFIDRTIGQEALGIWDFAWSLVSYFGLAEIGVGASVGRYVARYRAAGDVDGLTRVVSSALAVQLLGALVVVLLSAGVSLSLPTLFGDRLGAYTTVAAPVVACLGAGLALQLSFDVFHGVIVGSHRWDLHNAINAGSYAATVLAMITTVLLGGGLRGLAVANLSGIVVAELTRRRIAYRVCPELRLSRAAVDWTQLRSMIAFGMKSSVGSLSRLVLFQGVSLVVASHLGPAALALYARPAALIRHVETLVNKFANILTPMASSLQATGRDAELQDLLAGATRFGASLALPMVLFLAILGDPLLHLWMGPRYEQGLVLLILAAGFLLPLSQQPVVTILTGLNLHGRVGIVALVAALGGVGLGALTIGVFGWGLAGAAVAVTVALTIGNGLFVPIYACRRLRMSVPEYLKSAYLLPVACVLPYAACLLATRHYLGERPLAAVGCGIASALVTLPPLYWRYVLPPDLRDKVLQVVARRRMFRRVQHGAC